MKKMVISGIILVLGLCTSTYSQIPVNGLIAYWPFNGNANDATGNGNDGFVYGATLTTDRFGNPNSAYYFNGINNYISLESNTKLNLGSSSRTICAWIKTTNSSTQCIVTKAKRNNPYTGYCFYYNDYTNKCLIFAVTNTYNTHQYIKVESATSLADNAWHFVVGIYDGTNGFIKLYADCQLLTDTTIFGFNGTYNGDFPCSLEIGSRGKNDGYSTGALFFHGKIDDIRIYNRVLTLDEIRILCGEITSVNANDEGKIKIYPNPTNDFITIEANNTLRGNFQLNLSDIQGRKILSETVDLSNSYKLNLGGCDDGMYILSLQNENDRIVQKVVIQR